MNRMFSTWHNHTFDCLIQVGAIIQIFLVVNIQIFQVIKNSNISGCLKLIHVILFVQNSNFFGCQKNQIFLVVKIEKTIYIFHVSFPPQPLSVKPLRQESVPYFLSSCSEAWTDHGEVFFCTEFTTCLSTFL